jgi:hypothetical protein
MTLVAHDPYTPTRFSLFGPFAHLLNTFISARQKQADERIARHLRELPDDLIRRIGVSTEAIEALRQLARKREERAGKLIGRVTTRAVLGGSRE